MKRILYIHHAGSLGGAPRSLALLISNLPKDKYKPIVLMVSDGPAKNLFIEAGAEVFVEPKLGVFHGTTVSGMSIKLFLKNILSVPNSIYYGSRWIRKINPDLVHLNTTCLFMYAKITKRIFPEIPIISHVREPLLNSFAGKILRYMNYKYTDGYIAIEKYDLSKMKLDNKLVKVVYNSVDFDLYNQGIASQVLRTELKLDKNDVIFLYLARIAKSNGTLELLKMINESNIDSKYKFVIVGASNNPKDLYEQQVKEEAKKCSNIFIMKFRQDVPDVIASSDVIVMPFIEPHFARAVIEGAAMAKPAIVSDVRGLDELVEDKSTGYVYKSFSREDFIEKVKILGEDKSLRESMGKKAAERAKKLFNSVSNSEAIYRTYDEITYKMEGDRM
jgi:glycosyltransferase involved in cell wall biosynthesis